jgi:hypothetical protein
VLKDHKSRNGTFLNEKPVEMSPLQFGDVIGIGDMKLAFDCAANAASGKDDAAAAAAYRAMVVAAPNFRAALGKLGALSGQVGADGRIAS